MVGRSCGSVQVSDVVSMVLMLCLRSFVLLFVLSLSLRNCMHLFVASSCFCFVSFVGLSWGPMCWTCVLSVGVW